MRWGNRLVLGFVAALMLIGALAGSATAQEGDDEATEEESEGGESVRGQLVDRGGTREPDDDEPVPDAEITITGQGFSDTVTSDDDGRFELELPGPGQYTAELDTETLPDDVGLAEGGEVLTFNLQPNQSRPLLFQLGARERTGQSRLDRFPQLAFEGLKFGLLIAITSVGLSLIFGTTGLVNFAHGEMVTWGAIVAWWINVDHNIHLILAAVLAIGIGALTGAGLERGLWRPLRERGMSLVAMMIVSIGLSLAARNFFQLRFGEVTRPYNDYVIQRGVDIGPIVVAHKDLWAIAISLVVLVLTATMLQYTRQGKAIRAVSDNPDLAASSGIDVNRVILYVWAGGGALATIGGILFAVGERVQFNMGFQLLLLMFAGTVLGGLGTAYGALVGSLAVGLLVQLSTLFIATELKNVGALAVLVIVLLIRPQGILGRAERVG